MLKEKNKIYFFIENLKTKKKNKKLNSIKIKLFFIKKNQRIKKLRIEFIKKYQNSFNI